MIWMHKCQCQILNAPSKTLWNVVTIVAIGRKSEAIGSARNAYEDAYQRVEDARAEVDEAEVGSPSWSLTRNSDGSNMRSLWLLFWVLFFGAKTVTVSLDLDLFLQLLDLGMLSHVFILLRSLLGWWGLGWRPH